MADTTCRNDYRRLSECGIGARLGCSAPSSSWTSSRRDVRRLPFLGGGSGSAAQQPVSPAHTDSSGARAFPAHTFFSYNNCFAILHEEESRRAPTRPHLLGNGPSSSTDLWSTGANFPALTSPRISPERKESL